MMLRIIIFKYVLYAHKSREIADLRKTTAYTIYGNSWREKMKICAIWNVKRFMYTFGSQF